MYVVTSASSFSYTIRYNRSHLDLFEHHFPPARNHRLQTLRHFYRPTISNRWTYTRRRRQSSHIYCHCKEDHVSTNDWHSGELQQLRRPSSLDNSCHILHTAQPSRRIPRSRLPNRFQLKYKDI